MTQAHTVCIGRKPKDLHSKAFCVYYNIESQKKKEFFVKELAFMGITW